MAARILRGCVFEKLPEIEPGSIDCAVTSPPYFALRSYLPKGHPLKHLELGSEKSVEAYIDNMVRVFRLVRECLSKYGTAWCNIGDSYSGGGIRPALNNLHKRMGAIERTDTDIPGIDAGNLCLIPQRLALALQSDGWICRSVIIWQKASPMPASLCGWQWRRCKVKIANRKPAAHKYNADGIDGRNTGQNSNAWNGIGESAQWSDCPGCPKCSPHGGYVLRRGSWRPTSSYEPVLMLAKSKSYFADGIPVQTKAAASTTSRDKYTRVLDDPDEQFAVQHDHETVSDGGANLRDVWKVSAEPLHNMKVRIPVYVGVDEASDGMERITSRDCPIHGHLLDASVSYDEHSTEKSSHTTRNDYRPGQEHLALPCPNLDQSSAASEPSPAPSHVAKGHSKQKNKKRHGIQTIQQDTISEETSACTSRKSSRPAFDKQRHDMTESNTSAYSACDDQSPLEQTPCYTPDKPLSHQQSLQHDESHHDVCQNTETNKISHESDHQTPAYKTDKTSTCKCSFKKYIIKEISHYASFPTNLVRLCLQAGVSARGYCPNPKCGAPWVRVVEGGKLIVPDDRKTSTHGRKGSECTDNGWSDDNFHPGGFYETKTIGWRPTCSCPPAEPRCGRVLDPFAGSGRTGVCALRLGLDFAGVELNDTYCDMAERILREESPLFSAIGEPA